MADTSTDTQGMRTAAGYIATTASNLQGQLSTVESAVSSLRSTWAGETARTYGTAIGAWLDEGHRIINLLSQMVEVLDGNRQVITSGEASNQTIAARIPSGSGLAI